MTRRREVRGGGRSGRAIRHRGPRWWSGRLRDRAVRRRRGPRTSRWSRRTGSAGRACTGAASRPRSSSRPPRSCARSSGAPDFGVDAGVPTLDLGRAAGPQAGGRRPPHEGPRVAAQGPQRHRRAARGARWPTPPRHRGARSPTAPRSRGDNLVVATGSYPRALPGLDFDGTRVLSSDHVLAARPSCRRGSRSSAAV